MESSVCSPEAELHPGFCTQRCITIVIYTANITYSTPGQVCSISYHGDGPGKKWTNLIVQKPAEVTCGSNSEDWAPPVIGCKEEGRGSARCFRRKLDLFSQTHSDFSSNNTERERERCGSTVCCFWSPWAALQEVRKQTCLCLFFVYQKTVNKQQKQDSETFKVMKRKTWNWSQITVTLVTSLINNQINNIRKLVCLIKHRSVMFNEQNKYFIKNVYDTFNLFMTWN